MISLKRPLTKRKINDNSNMILKTYYLNRKGERSLNHQKTYIRNLKLFNKSSKYKI